MRRLGCVALGLALILALSAGALAAQKLTIWSMLTQESRAKTLERIAQGFEKEHPGVDVEIVVMPWGGAMDKMVAAILAGNPPDLATVGQGWPQSLAGTGGIVTLDDVVQRLGGPDAFLGTSLKVLGSLEGKVYSVPLYVTPHVVLYRRSWLAEVGKAAPTTWEELYDAARAVTDPRKGRYGFAIPFDLHGGKPIWGFLLANGVTIFEPSASGGWTLNVNQPATVETYDYLARLMRDTAPPGVVTYTTNEIRELIAKGVIMARHDTPELFATVREYNPALIKDFGFFPLPPRKRYGSSQGWVGLAVFNTPRQQLAKEFIVYLLRQDNLIDFCLSYPEAMFPALASAYNNARYFNGLPDELKPLATLAPQVLMYSSGISMWYGSNPWAGEIENKMILPNALNRMLVAGISAREAAAQVEREIRALMGP